tara:strand:- start:316 stop:612 length:297 start_codon:yes stop_codon:yes gene_type:complete
MITVIYDPLHPIGIPDGMAMHCAEVIVAMDGSDPDPIIIGTGLVVDAIRVLVKTGKADHTTIQFKYKDTILPINENGHIEPPWPEGFNDTMINLLEQL